MSHQRSGGGGDAGAEGGGGGAEGGVANGASIATGSGVVDSPLGAGGGGAGTWARAGASAGNSAAPIRGDGPLLLSACADATNGSSMDASNARKLTKGLDRIAATNGNILRRGKRGK